jgi:anti-sigma factor RsiW
MSRRHVHHLLSGYIDGALSPVATRFVESHLAWCPECTRELAQWRAVLRLVSQHAAMTCPIDCAESVLASIESRRARRLLGDGEAAISGRAHLSRQPDRFSRTRPSTAIALVLAGLLLGGIWLEAGSRLHRAPGPHGLALTLRIPGRRVDVAANPGLAASRSPASPEPPVRAHTPDRLQEAFGRNDRLILAADFDEDDR